MIALPLTVHGAPVISEGKSDVGWSAVIDYSGKWQGNLGADFKIKSIDGRGSSWYTFSGAKTSISVYGQKMDDSSKELSIRVYYNGDLVDEGSTDAAYGVCMVPVGIYQYE